MAHVDFSQSGLRLLLPMTLVVVNIKDDDKSEGESGYDYSH